MNVPENLVAGLGTWLEFADCSRAENSAEDILQSLSERLTSSPDHEAISHTVTLLRCPATEVVPKCVSLDRGFVLYSRLPYGKR